MHSEARDDQAAHDQQGSCFGLVHLVPDYMSSYQDDCLD